MLETYIFGLLASALLGTISEGMLNAFKKENWAQSGINGFLVGFALGIATFVFKILGWIS